MFTFTRLGTSSSSTYTRKIPLLGICFFLVRFPGWGLESEAVCHRMSCLCDDIYRRAQNRTFLGFEKDSNQAWLGPFRFIQAADTQYTVHKAGSSIFAQRFLTDNVYGLIDELKYVNWNGPIEAARVASQKYKSEGRSVWDEEIRLARLAVHQWNHMVPKPKFVVICGDLVNDYPGERQRADQIVDFKRTFTELDPSIPLVLLPGNHDLLNRPSVQAIQQYRRDFGDDYFSFWVGGVMFIVLNVQYHKDRVDVEALADEHDRWIEQRLEEVKTERNRYKHVIVFQHIPWFIKHVDEEDDATFNIALSERKRMIEKFSSAGIRAIFAGHYHRNAGGHYEEMEMVVTSAMGAVMMDTETGLTGKSGYRIVDVEEDRIEHRFEEIEP